MKARYARVFPISPPVSDMKNPLPIRPQYPIFRTLIRVPQTLYGIADIY